MSSHEIKPGDWIIYCKTKYGPKPGNRAKNVEPTAHGDEYIYTVDKFWVVANVASDGLITLKTRRGKEHVVSRNDPHLRRPRFWERWWYRDRFQMPDVTSAGGPRDGAQVSSQQPVECSST